MVGLLAGLADSIGYFLSLSRIFMFFPFFIAGVVFEKKQLDFGRTHKIFALFALSACAICAYKISKMGVSVQWLYGSFSYKALGVNWQEGVLIRGVQYIVAAVMSLSFLILSPRKPYFLSNLGQQTFYPYVLHGFVLKGLGALGFYTLWENEAHTIILIPGSVLLTVLLAHSWVRSIAAKILGAGLLERILFLNSRERSV